jgi:hypothetical protein
MYPILIAVVISALLSAGGAWKYQEYKFAAKELARVEAEAELQKMNELAAHVASTAHENSKIKIKKEFLVVTSEIENVVTKVEYRDRICFDDDGLRAHARAVRVTGAASEPSYGVPTPAVP